MHRLLFGLLFLSLSLPTAAAQDVKGTIKKLDLDTGVLVVRPYYQATEQELSLAGKDVPVTNAIGEPARLDDLRVGSRVVFKMDKDFVTAVKLDGPAIWGTLKKLDRDSRTLELEDPVRTHVVTLPEKVRFLLDGADSTLDRLKVGQAVQVVFTPDEKTILQVLTGKSISARDPHRKLTRVRGTLLEVDLTRRTVTAVTHPLGSPLVTVKMPLTANVAVHYECHMRPVGPGRLTDLTGVPLQATLILDEDTQTIDGIEVDLPAYTRRKIVAVDLETKKLRIEDSKNKSLELPLDPEARVQLVAGRGQASDLRPGQLATLALSPDRSRIVYVVVLAK